MKQRWVLQIHPEGIRKPGGIFCETRIEFCSKTGAEANNEACDDTTIVAVNSNASIYSRRPYRVFRRQSA